MYEVLRFVMTIEKCIDLKAVNTEIKFTSIFHILKYPPVIPIYKHYNYIQKLTP